MCTPAASSPQGPIPVPVASTETAPRGYGQRCDRRWQRMPPATEAAQNLLEGRQALIQPGEGAGSTGGSDRGGQRWRPDTAQPAAPHAGPQNHGAWLPPPLAAPWTTARPWPPLPHSSAGRLQPPALRQHRGSASGSSSLTLTTTPKRKCAREGLSKFPWASQGGGWGGDGRLATRPGSECGWRKTRATQP